MDYAHASVTFLEHELLHDRVPTPAELAGAELSFVFLLGPHEVRVEARGTSYDHAQREAAAAELKQELYPLAGYFAQLAARAEKEHAPCVEWERTGNGVALRDRFYDHRLSFLTAAGAPADIDDRAFFARLRGPSLAKALEDYVELGTGQELAAYFEAQQRAQDEAAARCPIVGALPDETDAGSSI